MRLKLNILFCICSITIMGNGYSQYKEEDWKDRDSWMNVSKIFKLAEIKSGNVVADLGCHEGYLTMHLSKKVGSSGNVYAIDVRKDRLNRLEEHLVDRKITNVKTILGDYDNPKLSAKSIDIVMIVDTYHEIKEFNAVLKHVKTSLNPDGKIVIIEKLKKHMREKPRDQQVDAHTLSIHYVKNELLDMGFSILNEIENLGNWENDPNKTIWMLVATK